ncbi:hypothetical protein D046_1108B, partial [Vibrio parahaemolyticus V-223/04]
KNNSASRFLSRRQFARQCYRSRI